VLEEVETFLKCEILAQGFLPVVCDECHDNRLVAFTCKRRGFSAARASDDGCVTSRPDWTEGSSSR
jgi:hypothetical protein